MFNLIKHSLRMRRTQSVATLVSVAITVAVVFALGLTSAGVDSGMQKSRARFGADIMLVPAEAASSLDTSDYLFTGSPVGMYMDATVVNEVAGVTGVSAVTPQFYGQTLDASCCSAASALRLIGYDAATDWVIAPWTNLPEGQRLGASQAVVGSAIAPEFPEDRGKVLGRPIEVVSVIDPTGTDLDYSVLLDIDTVRELEYANEAFADQWERYGHPSELISAVMVQVDDDYVAEAFDGDRDAAIEFVAASLGGIEGVSVLQSSLLLANVQDNLDALLAIMKAAAVLLAVACALQLLARFYTVAWDRRSQIALYRAVGASKRQVSTLIVGEAGVLVGAGLVIGLVLGAVLYLVVPGMLAANGSFPFVAPGPGTWVLLVVAIAVACALLCLLSVLVPLRRAARIEPAAAMQMADID